MWLTNHDFHDLHAVVIENEKAYAILSACLAEMLLALQEGNTERIYDLADALHNVPIILTEGGKKMLSNVKREVSYAYRPKWNKDFLKPIV